MKHPIHWLYQQFVGSVPTGNAQCYLCGASCPLTYTVAKGIAETFNSHYLAKCPSSKWLCAACQWYFDSHAGHPDFRKMSLIVYQNRWYNWDRAMMKVDIDLWLTFGVKEDAFLILSLSKKKHILLQAPLNTKQAKTLAIQIEEQVAHLDSATWEYINGFFLLLLSMGHTKGEILSGNLHSSTLRKHGRLTEALVSNEQLEPYRNSAILELLSYVTIIEKEESNDRGTDDVPERTRDQADSSRTLEGSLQRDKPRLSEPIPHDDLDANRGSLLKRGQDVQQPALFSE